MLEIVPGVGDDHAARLPAARGSVRAPAWRRRRRPTAPPRRRGLTGTGPRRPGARARAAGLAGAIQLSPRTSTTGCASSPWPMTSDAADSDLVGEARDADLQRATEQVGIAAQVEQRGQSRRTDRDSCGAAAPGAAEAVGDDHGQRHAEAGCELGAQMLGASGRDRSAAARRFSTPSVGPTLDWSMPALAMTKPSRCSTISTLGRERTTRTDSERISSTSRGSLLHLASEGDSLCRRLHLGQFDRAALRLRNDLLGDHDDVAARAASARCAPGPRRSGQPDRRPP